MKNIFNELDYNNSYSVEEWNDLIKKIFLKYFNNEKKLIENKEILRTELINYIKIYRNNDYIDLLDKIHTIFQNCIKSNKKKSLEIWLENFENIVRTDDRYLSYFIQQPNVDEFTKKDFAMYYFKAIDEIIEGCYKPRFHHFYQFYQFKKNPTLENVHNNDFGKSVTDEKFIGFDILIKDPIYCITVNQWRNIASHKDYKISKDTIEIKYGVRRDKIKVISHEELKDIVFWLRDVYGSLRLAEVLISLNYMKDIMRLEKANNTNIEIRSEASLLHIVHNLQIVGFKFDSIIESEQTFTLNLFVKNNNDIKESIIHATQVFSRIACALDDDEEQKGKFTDLRINIINKEKEILANAMIDIKSCLKFAHHKLSQKELIYKIRFNS